MSNVDSAAVRNCWYKIKSTQGKAAFVDNFYQYMFGHYPEIRDLFPENLSAQKANILTTLDNVINGIDFTETLEAEFFSLGQHHKSLGVKKEMFEMFIITIVEVARMTSDDTLTQKELTAWEKAFREISNIMLKAYESPLIKHA